MLNKYLTRTTYLLGPSGAAFWNNPALLSFINEARGQIAAEGQCIKVLPPGTNGINTITVNTGGNYAGTPTVVITGNGTGAIATANMSGTAVNTITVNTPGTAYDNTTKISFTGGTPTTQATATANINCVNTVANQEIYTFASVNPLAQLTAGVGSILWISSIAVSWGALKPTLQQWNFDDLQAKVRAYPILSGQPALFAQFGQGEGGSVYIQPVPTYALPMEWNCVCTPIDLVDDTTPEAIPFPWTDAVPYFTAYLALMNARRPMEADNMFNIYTRTMKRAREQSDSSFVEDFYA